ncbi:MAG: hypothetical protein K8T10_21975 [Candidatus Eremiobacteraeota bacterium]|nr:hypothetical protein [Candidatus Eremiobacteraeota bacterium]
MINSVGEVINMYSCPACGKEDVTGQITCIRCGTDLSLLKTLDSVADAWFNRALKEIDDGNSGRAIQWLSACCAARPMDAEALRIRAKVWGMLGHWKEARYSLEEAREIDPDALELKEIESALQVMEKQHEEKLQEERLMGKVSLKTVRRSTRRKKNKKKRK